MISLLWARPRARLGMVVGAFLVGCALTASLLTRPSLAELQSGAKAKAPVVSDAALAKRTAPMAALEDGFVAIGERVLPSVVSIRARRTVQLGRDVPDFGDLFRDFGMPGQGGQAPFRFRTQPRQFPTEAGGSGIIVRSDGWIITNDHVVDDAEKVIVKLEDGREFEGSVRRDFRSDLAMVKINATGLPAVEFADSDKVRVGQWAIAFGSPLALDDTMTLGIISAKKRQQAIAEGGEGRFYPTLLQTDASINPGNSGGPLVDINGKIIGINVAIKSPTGVNVGIGFAIPSNTASQVMEQLITKGKVVRGFMGVIPRPLTAAERQKYSVGSGGAMIETVSEGTPASRAGLQPEDIVVKINGKAIADDVAFREVVAATAPGQSLDLTVRRGGKEQSVKVTLEAAPEIGQAAAPSAVTGSGKLGLKVEPVTDDNARRYNLGDVRTGVVVVQVEAGSPADQAGMQPGDVIVRSNGREVANAADLEASVSRAKSGDRIPLVVRREKSRNLVTIEMP